MILAGDIGGTKTVLALYNEEDLHVRQLRDATYVSAAYPSLEAIVALFLAEPPARPLRAATFGVAGAVVNGRCRATNLPWVMDERDLARALSVPRVKLLNDLEAAAYGMLHLGPSEYAVLNHADDPQRRGNVAVIAAGTGLGEAILYWDGRDHHPIASEGGHVDFAPRTDQEIELLRYLRAKFGGHVSYERVLSGPGAYNLYQFLRDSGAGDEPAWLAERLRSGDPSAAIAEAGLAGTVPLCVATLELFTSIYGAAAGNLALKCLAVGGVFIGGGIAPKLLPALRHSRFMDAFADKGRFANLLRNLEVRVALEPRAPLLGAARYALRLC